MTYFNAQDQDTKTSLPAKAQAVTGEFLPAMNLLDEAKQLLANLEAQASQPEGVKLARELEMLSARLDQYLAKTENAPLSPVPQQMRNLAKILTEAV